MFVANNSLNCRPVILEIPHFASLRNYEREIVVLRSDNGEKWTEHTGPITDEAVREVFGDTVDSEGEISCSVDSHHLCRCMSFV